MVVKLVQMLVTQVILLNCVPKQIKLILKLNFLDKFFKKLHFLKVVIARFFTILFRRRKGIELLLLDYAEEHIFEKSYLVINYRFRNAIYYKFGNLKTLVKQIKIFDLQNLPLGFY